MLDYEDARALVFKNVIPLEKSLCPIAESFQPKIMKFKNNYRNLDVARRKIEILHKTITQIEQ